MNVEKMRRSALRKWEAVHPMRYAQGQVFLSAETGGCSGNSNDWGWFPDAWPCATARVVYTADEIGAVGR